MKKLILSVVLMAGAVAVQAGDAKTSPEQAKSPCCAEAKTATSTKAECPMAKEQCSMAKEAKSCCGGEAKSTAREQRTKQVLLSPKAASLASK